MTGFAVERKVEECSDVCCVLPDDNSTGICLLKVNKLLISLLTIYLQFLERESWKHPFASFGTLFFKINAVENHLNKFYLRFVLS